MFCPNCGANNLTEQKFCRSCGLNIEEVAASLLRQIPTAESSAIMRKQMEWEMFGKLAWSGFLLGASLVLISILYLIFDRFIISGTNIFFGVIFVLFLVFGVSMIVYIYKSQQLKQIAAANPPTRMADQLNAATTGKLADGGSFEPVSSVTEDSTALLPAEGMQRR